VAWVVAVILLLLRCQDILSFHFVILAVIVLTCIRETTDIGMHRLTLSDSDKQVRDWFVKTMEILGCKVQVDAMGT